MTPAELVYNKTRELPEDLQGQVLDFVEFLSWKNARPDEEKGWSVASFLAAAHGLEDQWGEEYTLADIKEFY